MQKRYDRLKKELNEKRKALEERRSHSSNFSNINKELKVMIAMAVKRKEQPN